MVVVVVGRQEVDLTDVCLVMFRGVSSSPNLLRLRIRAFCFLFVCLSAAGSLDAGGRQKRRMVFF